MIVELKILNTFCEVTVRSATMETDDRWQPYAVEYWQRLFATSPSESYRRGYSRHLIEEQTRQEALHRLKVCNAIQC